MQDCIFCKIVKKEIPSEVVYEDEEILVFKDLNPVAPVHLLIIPKKHIPALTGLGEEDVQVAGRIQLTAAKIARDMGFDEQGFRVVCNNGRDSGQLVLHIHYHLLAGRRLKWPPG